MKFIAALLAFFATHVAAADWNSTPEALVRSFQSDYKVWNDAAASRDSRESSSSAMREAQQEYDVLLRKYALPDFQGEPIAYGTESSHNPWAERIVSIENDGNRALVKTVFEAEFYSPEYEYELVRRDGRWYLIQVYLVDEDGRYPGL